MHHSFSCHSPSVRCLWTVSATQSNHRQSLVLASLSEHRGTPSTQYCIVHDTTIMIHHDISWSSPLGSKLEAGQINTVCGRIQGWKLALSNKQRCTMPINAWYSKCKLRLEATGTALMKHFASAMSRTCSWHYDALLYASLHNICETPSLSMFQVYRVCMSKSLDWSGGILINMLFQNMHSLLCSVHFSKAKGITLGCQVTRLRCTVHLEVVTTYYLNDF
jgi:hypothetical protein